MVERIITEGSKVELQRLASVAQNRREGTDKEVKTYYSLVSEVLDEDRIKITMPGKRAYCFAECEQPV